jgi:hypothetical protein
METAIVGNGLIELGDKATAPHKQSAKIIDEGIILGRPLISVPSKMFMSRGSRGCDNLYDDEYGYHHRRPPRIS